ncbi:hypothetical protein ACW5R3_09510 [Bizionia sp. KMM 8389]
MVLEHFILIVLGGLSAVLTFVLHVPLKQGPVRASALIGVLVGGFVWLFPDLMPEYFTKNVPLVCFGASFIGMVSSKVLSNYLLIGVSGAIFTIIFLNTSSYFNGFGGGLGSAACIALLVTLGIPIIRKSGRFSNGLLLLKKQKKSNSKTQK